MPRLDKDDQLFYEQKVDEITKQNMSSMFRMKEAATEEEKNRLGNQLEQATTQIAQTDILQDYIYRGQIRVTKAQKADLKLRDARNRNLLLLNSEKTFGDSGFMKQVKDSIVEYENILREKSDGTLEASKELAKRAEAKCMEVLQACDNYLARGKSIFFWRRQRYTDVQRARARFEEEQKTLLYMMGRKVGHRGLGAFEEELQGGQSLLEMMNLEKLKDSKKSRIAAAKEKKRKKIQKDRAFDKANPEMVLERRKKGQAKEESIMAQGNLHLEPVTEEEKRAVEKTRGKQNRKARLEEEKLEKERAQKVEKAKAYDEAHPEEVEERRKAAQEKEEKAMVSGKLHLDPITKEETEALKKEQGKKARKAFREAEEKFFREKPVEAIDHAMEGIGLEDEKFRNMFLEADQVRLKNEEDRRKTQEQETQEETLKKKIAVLEAREEKTETELEYLKQFRKELKELPSEAVLMKQAQETQKKFVKETIEYDRKERAVNEKKYRDFMKKNGTALKKLLLKKKLSAKESLQLRSLQQSITAMLDQLHTDRSVYARNATDMEVKKKLEFGSMLDLSEFSDLFKDQAGFENLLKEYGTGSKEAALDLVIGELLKTEIKPEEVLADEALMEHMDKYIGLSNKVVAFNSLLQDNPGYLEGKKEVQKKLDQLTAVSDYVRMKKQIYLSPLHAAAKEVTLENYGEKEDFRFSHYRRLRMVSRVMERNLRVSFGMKAEPDPILEQKQSNSFAEADRQYALRLSKESKLQKQVDGSTGVRRELLDKAKGSLERIRKMKEKAETAKEKNSRLAAVYELEGERLYLSELQNKLRREDDADPDARIKETLMILEEERLHVPFDFNMVDFDHIPDHRKGDIYDVCALNDALDVEDSEIRPGNVISKKMGYGQLEDWIKKFKEEQLIYKNQLGNIDFRGAKTMHDVKYSDNFDRILAHFTGSYHFHFTDAQIREQLYGLAFTSTKGSKYLEKDPEAMAYQEGLFRHMFLRQNAQMRGSVMRNLYGGFNKFLFMTPVDRRMAVNPYQKMDIMSAIVYSNVDDEINSGKYLQLCQEENKKGRFITMSPDISSMGGGMGVSMINVHGCLSTIGYQSDYDLQPKMQQEYKKFMTAYKKKNPKVSRKGAGLQFLLKHPALLSKATFLTPYEDAEQEKDRKENLKDLLQAGVSDEHVLQLLHNEYVMELTPKQLEAYKKRAKKDGFGGYELLSRMLTELPKEADMREFAVDLYEMTPEEFEERKANLTKK